MTLQEHNTACRFQADMDPQYALKFAQALPHVDAEIDFDAVHQFEVWQALIHPNYADALDFLRKVVEAAKDRTLVHKLSGVTPLEGTLCGI